MPNFQIIKRYGNKYTLYFKNESIMKFGGDKDAPNLSCQ